MERKETESPACDGRWDWMSSDIGKSSFYTDNMASHYRSNNK